MPAEGSLLDMALLCPVSKEEIDGQTNKATVVDPPAQRPFVAREQSSGPLIRAVSSSFERNSKMDRCNLLARLSKSPTSSWCCRPSRIAAGGARRDRPAEEMSAHERKREGRRTNARDGTLCGQQKKKNICVTCHLSPSLACILPCREDTPRSSL